MGIFSSLFGSPSTETQNKDAFAQVAAGLLFNEIDPDVGQGLVDVGLEGTRKFGKLVNKTPGLLEGGLGTGGANLFDQVGTFNTVFDKSQVVAPDTIDPDTGETIKGEIIKEGTLAPSAQGVFDTVINDVQAVNALGVNLGTQLSTAALNVNIPDLPSVKDVGTLTSEVISNLPPEMQSFINNIFEDSSPEAIAAELDNLSQAILADAENNADSIGRLVIGQFGAEGLGSSGAALKALQTTATQVAINANAKIAEARLAGLATLLQARDQGVKLVDTLTTLGRAEQASRVSENLAVLESQTRIATAQIQANVFLQNTLAEVSARLALGQLQYNATIFGNLVNQSSAQELATIGGAQSQINTLLALSTGQQIQKTGADKGAINRATEAVSGILDIF